MGRFLPLNPFLLVYVHENFMERCSVFNFCLSFVLRFFFNRVKFCTFISSLPRK